MNEPDRQVLCFQCGWVDVRRDDEQRGPSAGSLDLMRELERGPMPPPDTAPAAPESALHMVDRDALAVARDLLDRIRYGTSSPVLARVELRRIGWTDEEIDKLLGPSSRSRSRGR